MVGARSLPVISPTHAYTIDGRREADDRQPPATGQRSGPWAFFSMLILQPPEVLPSSRP